MARSVGNQEGKSMSGKDLQDPANNDVERLFQDISPIIPKVVCQACTSLDYHPDQMELNDLVQGIIFLLIADEYRMMSSFDHRSQPQTWLYTIARR
jgi:DNA-directed RNA polymerase specialized sigma24 family protein